MRTKKVNRYYCDYCKKSGCSSHWIKKHEERCTLNPDRVCGYCHLLDQKQSNLEELIALLPNPKEYKKINSEFGYEFFEGLEEAVSIALPKLREIAGACPACILAALRQKGIPAPLATDFDFKAEGQAIWDEFNTANLRY